MVLSLKNKPLEKKVAVVTGAGRGIGRAIATGYAKAGAEVCCAARTLSEITNTACDIIFKGGKSLAVQADVSNFDSVESLFKKTAEFFGGIDIVVINAGIAAKRAPVEKSDSEKWKKVIGTNLIGAYFTAKCAIPHLKKRGGGKIITIGSYFSYAASEGRSAYCCSKAGLSVLTRVLAEELREFDISVNELLPASVATKMNRKINPDEKTKTFQSITSLAVFLAAQPNIYPSGQSFSLYAKPIK